MEYEVGIKGVITRVIRVQGDAGVMAPPFYLCAVVSSFSGCFGERRVKTLALNAQSPTG